MLEQVKSKSNSNYLRQARQHDSMVSLVKGHEGKLNAQQLSVGLWQPTAACYKEQELLLELSLPAVHHLLSDSTSCMTSPQPRAKQAWSP